MADLALMQAMLQKMDWQEARMKTLAQNISHADTPGFQPHDLTPLDFKSLLGSSTSKLSLGAPAGMATTNAAHMTSGGASADTGKAKSVAQRETYETAPSGNAVVLEEQLMKMNETATDHSFISNLYEKNMKMLKDSSRSN